MTELEMRSDAATRNATRSGGYLGLLQLALSWAVYVVYLPKLLAEVGIAPAVVIGILMLDRLIFTMTDTAMGIAADRIAGVFGRLGVLVGALTAISSAAFIAMPLGRVPLMFIASLVILAFGYQLHFSLNSAPYYLRFAKESDLPRLLPVFWIGFSMNAI